MTTAEQLLRKNRVDDGVPTILCEVYSYSSDRLRDSLVKMASGALADLDIK